MKDYQMCMVIALVLNKKYNFSRIIFHYMKDNITSGSKSWVYPRFVQMMLDHVYPNMVKDEENDLMVLHHMDNETLIRLSKYNKNWPEPKTKTKFFGFIKDEKYEDPDPKKSSADELKKLKGFCETRNDWYTKEEKEKKKKRTPKAQTEEGSSSQPQKKRKKKAVETLLVYEPEEDETEVNVEKDQGQLSPETEQLIRDIDDTLEVRKSASKKVVDDEEKSLYGSENDIDAEVDRWIKENFDPRETKSHERKERGVQLTMMMKRMFLQRIFKLYNHHHQEKKVDEVLAEKKKLEKRVKTVESENSSLLKKVEYDQVEIDIMKVRIAVLEEEKTRRDEQNEFFKLKNKELEAKNAKKEHEDYMLKKVIKDLIGKPIEQRFEEIELEELRARHKAEIEAEMKNKGKSAQVEGVIEVSKRAIVPSKVLESSIQDPYPITSVPGDEDDEDDEEDEDDNLKDDADGVYSVHSDDDDDGNDDDDDQGSSGIKLN
ncbi:hypothetical protein Hanom_Chr00s000002g01600771 [Helianthus anomalus]